jgi:protease-4
MSDNNGREWQLLEKITLASVEEQKKARRWSIFFKLLTFAYLVVILVMVTSPSKGGKSASETSTEHLAIVELKGEIADSTDANADDLISSLTDAFEAKNSKAVVLRINSPGGSPVQSAYVYDAIKQLRIKYPNKKLYAVITDLGASGAYYIASAADQIYVSPASLVGSIGVVMQGFGLQELTKKLGVEDRTMTAGQHKAVLNPFRPVSAEEKAHVQKMLDTIHQQFISAVKQGRGQRLKEDPQIFSGLFWTGQQAVELGLADGFGSVKTINKLIATDEQVDYTKSKNPMDNLIRKLGVSMGETIATKLNLSDELKVR